MPTPERPGTPLTLHPRFLVREGRREYVVLPYEEFVLLQEQLADAEDLADLRIAREESAGEPSISLEDVKRELGIE